MKIECTIKRQGGSVHNIGGTEYHFKPEEGGSHDDPHVAEVTDQDAIDRFLSITSSFRAADTALADESPQQQGAAVDDDSGGDDPTDYLLTNDDGTSVDLGKMDKAELIAWAEANGIAVDKRKSLATLLPAVFEAAIAD